MRRPSGTVLVTKSARNKIRITTNKVNLFRAEIRQYFDKNSYLSWSTSKKKYVVLGSNEPKNGLVVCPSCNVGKLMVIRSRTTKKRFIGCSNYYNGCRASSPLLQKAMLCVTKMPCEQCLWPHLLFRYSRRQKWRRQCANINCPTRRQA
ncbi:MAG: DNA topoisomerase [Candidatus Nitrosotenuis sp.]